MEMQKKDCEMRNASLRIAQSSACDSLARKFIAINRARDSDSAGRAFQSGETPAADFSPPEFSLIIPDSNANGYACQIMNYARVEAGRSARMRILEWMIAAEQLLVASACNARNARETRSRSPIHLRFAFCVTRSE